MRCFVALWPDQSAAHQLDAAARAQQSAFPGTRLIRRENLHLTLAFIGQLERGAAQRLADHLAALDVPPFEWSLDRIGSFRAARVLWAGGPPQAQLDALARRIRAELDGLGLRYDPKPFKPHVTLLRDLSARGKIGAQITPAIVWRVGRPSLAQSIADPGGMHYVRLPAR